jgi:tetratricopeptide (TPR) repeat protein
LSLQDKFEQKPLYKWIFYFVIGLIGITPMIYGFLKMSQGGSWGQILVLLIFLFIPCAAFLAIFFTPFLIEKTIASPIGQLFTGNPNVVEDKPIYGSVISSRNQGDYRHALELVEVQLEKYPFDFDGLMLKAAIQAEDYNDLDSAIETLNIILNDKDNIRYNLPIVYNKLADWQLNIFNSTDCALKSLEKIQEIYPGTKAAQLASQRIASMHFHNESINEKTEINDTYCEIVEESSRTKTEKGIVDIPKIKKLDKINENKKLLSEYLRRVKEHPESIINREDLARYYFDESNEWSMAIQQYEQLINMLGSTSSQKVTWLNKIVDIQLKSGASLEEMTLTLNRVIDIAPESAASNRAKSRIMHLPIEIRGVSKKKAPLKLERRDEDLGLM